MFGYHPHGESPRLRTLRPCVICATFQVLLACKHTLPSASSTLCLQEANQSLPSACRGAICTFGTESTLGLHSYSPPFSVLIQDACLGTGFSAAFPGIVPHLLTLTSNFRVPFYRDIILAMGICSVSKESCSNILKGGPGQAITIVVGGAAESLSAHPGTADLTLRKRCVARAMLSTIVCSC